MISILDYADFYPDLSENRLSKLEHLQNIVIRFIFNLPKLCEETKTSSYVSIKRLFLYGFIFMLVAMFFVVYARIFYYCKNTYIFL
jgi:hypothetical protein